MNEFSKKMRRDWRQNRTLYFLVLPVILFYILFAYNSDESREYATIMNEVKTYRDEMTIKFIMGQESLDSFDEYVANIKKLGIDRALEIQNAALERYNAR